MRTYPTQNLSIFIIETLFFWIVGGLASFTIATHISQVLGLSFNYFTYIGILLSSISFIIGIIYAKKRRVGAKDIKSLGLILVVSLFTGALGLLSHSSSSDSFFYVPNVVYMLDNPNEPMSFGIHFFDSGEGCNTTSYIWGTSIAFDYARGAVSNLLDVNYLTVYYMLSSAVVSFLIPMAYFLLLSHFSENTLTTVAGTVVILGVLFLLGETHRTYGNFTVTRAYEGKTVLLAFGIPLFISFTLSYFKSPSRYYWLLLFGASTALLGVSPSALVILPALAVVLWIAHFSIMDDTKIFIKQSLFFFFSFGYLFFYGVLIMANMTTNLGIDSIVNYSYATTFEGQLRYIIRSKSQFPPTLIAVVVGSALTIYFSKQKQRTFILVWMISAIILFLNPIVSNYLILYFTSPNIYWRLFYIFPFPLLIGLSTIHLIKILARYQKSLQYAIVVIVGLALILPHFNLYSSSIFRSTDFRFPPTRHKLPPKLVDQVYDIVNIVPDGTMLAPGGISGIIPMVSSGHQQMVIRREEVRLWLGECGRDNYARIRIAASKYVQGDDSKILEFRQFLLNEGDQVKSIIMIRDGNSRIFARADLKNYGFVNKMNIGNYVAFWK